MVLGSETDQYISEFQLRALIREGDFLGSSGR